MILVRDASQPRSFIEEGCFSERPGIADFEEKGPAGPGQVHFAGARGIVRMTEEQYGLGVQSHISGLGPEESLSLSFRRRGFTIDLSSWP
jgi:hypothetical protein